MIEKMKMRILSKVEKKIMTILVVTDQIRKQLFYRTGTATDLTCIDS